MDATGITITLGSLITIGLFLIALSNFFGGKKKSTKEEEARLVRIEALCAKTESNTSDLKKRVDHHDERLDDHEHRITVVETKQKISHPRGGK